MTKEHKISWKKWIIPFTGAMALIWFIVRVIPKPSRATYPCQRVAFPVASAFLVYLIGGAGWFFGFYKAKKYLRSSSLFMAGICINIAILSLALPLLTHLKQIFAHSPTITVNDPIGIAKGINPGRVVWIHDPEATSWDGSTGYWWEDGNTDQKAVDDMISKAIRWLTGEQTDESAWDALFKHFNQMHGKGVVGYQAGEKVVVKINLNNKYIQDGYAQEEDDIDASPQTVLALLRQLVNHGKVESSLITVYDAKRLIPDSIYHKCTEEFPDVRFMDQLGREGRVPRQMVDNSVHFSDAELEVQPLPKSVIQADYMINLAILKRHGSVAAVSLCAKNHFGTIPNPGALHEKTKAWNFDFDTYDPKVDLMGHEDLGGKTVLFIIDGLYSGASASAGKPSLWRMPPFNGDWPSSIFVSQDGVAIDSVGYDFSRENWILKENGDRYLHEAALAGNPPSGTVYDPEGDGTALSSLGVHEHWNNPVDKQYSRNLGIGYGIELINSPPTTSHSVFASEFGWIGCCEIVVSNCKEDSDKDCDVDGLDLADIASRQGSDVSSFAAHFGQMNCCETAGSTCENDLDKDCDVDGLDLAAIISGSVSDLSVFATNFGHTGCCRLDVFQCEGDFDGDCDVDGLDLAYLLTIPD